jgi:uncharacterized membrane protein YkvA (DUF1232 family)
MFVLWRLWRRIGGWRALFAQALLAWRLLRDPRVSRKVKFIPLLAIIYFLSPINLAFAWIPFFGQIDDFAIAILTLGAFVKACPDDLVNWHASRLEREMTKDGRFKSFGRFARFVQPSFTKWTGDDTAGKQRRRPEAR